ncbi:alpha/beta hydrolase [Paludisphaera rhizosphaerae]|uniref:alpha/beta hydrolase n=1 Tax=Paludisphaera rhizosphaerae TaxID=2711216 RepID=UPI0013EC010F|nr:alpha/beta fold hydrolase [Paludisphaera rhizosphaerae]
MATAKSLRRRIFVTVVPATVLLLISLYISICWITAERLTRPTNHLLDVDVCRLSDDAEPWSTRTQDGLTLRGWRLTSGERQPLIVLVHGMWNSRLEVAELGRDLHTLGFDVLLFDFRGHGESDPSRLTLGIQERLDLRAVLAWARRMGYAENRIGWLGYSMGAATLLLEAADNPSIRTAVVDSPYGDLPGLLDTQLPLHSGLPRWFNPGILACARMLYGLRAEELVPTEAASAWGNRPVFLIHGESDSIVPVEQALSLSRSLGAACATTILPGVEHVKAYETDPENYVEQVGQFFRRHLAP